MSSTSNSFTVQQLKDIFDKNASSTSKTLSFEAFEQATIDLGIKYEPCKNKYQWGYEKHNNCDTWKDHYLSACGHYQSPININTIVHNNNVNINNNSSDEKINNNFVKNDLNIECKHPPFIDTEVFNNGHTVQWLIKNSEDINCELIIQNHSYKLVQFHFHIPTEHTFNNEQKKLEIHFVHADIKTGELAVMGFLFDVIEDKDETTIKENGIFNSLKTVLPIKQDDKHKVHKVNLIDLDFNGRWCHYSGSLTTPPCTEGVRWFVNLKTFNISKSTLNLFSQSITCSHNKCGLNARKIQPSNNRPLYEVQVKQTKVDHHTIQRNICATDDIKHIEHEKIVKVFNNYKIDDGHNGECLGMDEFLKAATFLGYSANMEFKFRQLDSDFNQTIDINEFIKIIELEKSRASVRMSLLAALPKQTVEMTSKNVDKK